MKIFLIVLGFVSLLEGAGLSFFVSGSNQYEQIVFINLVYISVFYGALVSLVSGWIAGILLLADGIAAVGLIVSTGYFGHGLASSGPIMWTIISRPLFSSLLLLVESRWENEKSLKSKFRNVFQPPHRPTR